MRRGKILTLELTSCVLYFLTYRVVNTSLRNSLILQKFSAIFLKTLKPTKSQHHVMVDGGYFSTNTLVPVLKTYQRAKEPKLRPSETRLEIQARPREASPRPQHPSPRPRRPSPRPREASGGLSTPVTAKLT